MRRENDLSAKQQGADKDDQRPRKQLHSAWKRRQQADDTGVRVAGLFDHTVELVYDVGLRAQAGEERLWTWRAAHNTGAHAAQTSEPLAYIFFAIPFFS